MSRSGKWGADMARVGEVASRFAALAIADPAEAARLRAACARKVKIASKGAARTSARKLRSKMGDGFPYECQVCGFWHVSKMAPGDHRDMEHARGGSEP